MTRFSRIMGVAMLAFAVDQISKFYILHVLDLPRIGRMTVFEGFNLSMAWNRGINFGLFASDDSQAQLVLIVISLVISFLVYIWARKMRRRAQIGAGLIIGGALGNALDRALYDGVADFLNVSCCGINNPYAFNIADIAIFLGAAILIIWNTHTKTAGTSAPKENAGKTV